MIMRACLALKDFYTYKHSSGENLSDFIVHFEKLYHKMVTHDTKLSEAVKAYFLITAANISEENEKLA